MIKWAISWTIAEIKIIFLFSLTNRNKDLSINLYNKKSLTINNSKNIQSNSNKTPNYIQNGELNESKIHRIKNISDKKGINIELKALLIIIIIT